MSAEQSILQPPIRSTARWLRNLGFDPWLVLLVASMLAFGLVMVYSASWDVSWRLYQDPAALFRKQLTNLLFGLVAMAAAMFIPIRWLRRLALPVILVTLLALISVLLINAGGGPRRSFLSGSIQPSEMAKLACVLYLAVWMESKGERVSDWSQGFVPLMVLIGVISGLILLQPDLSAVLTVALVALTMFYFAGATPRQALFITGGSAIIGYLLVRVTQTGRERWDTYLAGLLDVEKASYHVQHSLQAFFAGGFFGRGLGASREKFGFLPAPHTDSIFAIVGEELGLMGAALVILLFALLLWRGFRLSANADDRLKTLLGTGVTFWLGVEALVNMSVLLGLLPFAGNALPFFSFGGSNLVMSLVGVGLLLNISRRPGFLTGLRGHLEIIGIGWRHRRRSVSRLGHRRRVEREA